MSQRAKDQITTLRCWHDVEFFRSFDLDQVLDRYPTIFTVTSTSNDAELPWTDPTAAGLRADIQHGLEVFIGIFSLSGVTKELSHLLSANGQVEARAWQLPDCSCVARLFFHPDGSLGEISTCSFSTMPWALARLKSKVVSNAQAGMENGLATFNIMATGLCEKLVQILALRTPITPRRLAVSALFEVEPDAKFPNADTLRDLAKCIEAVALAEPRFEIFVPELCSLITPRTVRKRKVISPEASIEPRAEISIEGTDNEEEPSPNSPSAFSTSLELKSGRRPLVDILNSFYLHDLERGAAGISTRIAPTLESYINPQASVDRIDVVRTVGQVPRNHVPRPAEFAKNDSFGACPSDSRNSLGPDQQRALSRYIEFHKSKACGVPLAVGGPPGTGKSTLIRELPAHLVVERARLLVKLAKPEDAFGPNPRTSGDYKNSRFFTQGIHLAPALCDFGLVLLSSNNAAVENISKEPPSMRSISTEFDEITYLAPIAVRLQRAYKGQAQANSVILSTEASQAVEARWCGIISSALGRASNRKRFIDAVLYHPRARLETIEQKIVIMGAQDVGLAEWRNCAALAGSLTFRQAQAAFGAGSLANVIIEEAARTLPQAGVGALWRAQRALIVGDQRQLEPIPAVAPELDDYLARDFIKLQIIGRAGESSIQSLADFQSTEGTYFGETRLDENKSSRVAVGLPLLTHRRCAAPMFSIANSVAYDDMMNSEVSTSYGDSPFGPSRWIHVGGSTSGRNENAGHRLAEQGDVVKDLLTELACSGSPLSPFIITPFKAGKTGLLSKLASLRDDEQMVKQAPRPAELRKRIGTIHTFQGKEADIMFLVLGCSFKTVEAADWAGARPNLVNVAVTRAKRFLNVIDDRDLWHRRGYLEELYAGLRNQTEQASLSRPPNTILETREL